MKLEPVQTASAPAAIGPYSQAVKAGGLVYCSGQIALDPEKMELVGATVEEQAVQVMKENDVSSLVVDKRDESDEYGILVVHDIARDVVAKDRSPDRVNVYEIMSKPVLSVDVGMNVKYAVRLLTRFQLTRALVLDRGKVVGIVTLRDLVIRSLA